MVDIKNRNWQIVAKCEKVVGFWPYQPITKGLALAIWFVPVMLLCIITMVIRLKKDWHALHIVVEDLLALAVQIAMLIKFVVLMMRGRRREILERIATHFETMVDEEEAAILRENTNRACLLTFKYIGFVVSAMGLYDIMPVVRMFYNYYYLGEGKLEKQLPFYVDYLVDEQEYYYYILAHLSLVVVSGAIVELTVILNFFLGTRHVCALFETMKLRLKRASEIFERYNHWKQISKSDEQKAYEYIMSAVDLLIEAFELIDLIEELYRNCWFTVLLLNMAGIAPIPVAVLIYIHDPLEVFRRTLAFSTALAHFYVVFLQGQLIIDYSSSVFEACYEFCWYNASKRCRVAISIMMMQSITPKSLTGTLFELSMETYSVMLKTALSYVSMFLALDIQVESYKG